MPHGSSWSREGGFAIAGDESERDLEAYVARKGREKQVELSALYAREKGARIGFEEFERFFRSFLGSILPLRPFLGIRWAFVVEEEAGTRWWVVDVRRGRILRLDREPENLTSVIRVHPAVLSDALRDTVLTNVDIAKRWRVHVRRGGLTRHLLMWVLLSLHEAGCFEPRNLLRWRFVSGWFRPRSEILDYAGLCLAMLRKDKAAAAQAVTEPL